MLPCLSGLEQTDIKRLFAGLSPPPPAYRAAQVYRWIRAGVHAYDSMTDIDAAFRSRLAALWPLRCTSVDEIVTSKDGTVKLRIKMTDGCMVEAVILEDGSGRRTACLSSQAGCRMGCVFCKTGSLGFSRNLEAAEMMEQLYHIQAYCAKQSDESISNIVFMGMGEPLLNLGALRKVCSILSGNGRDSDETPGEAHVSKKRLTVSTCGLADKIRDMAAAGPDIRLAVSITTAREELRRRLMPASSPLAEIKDALLFYKKQRGRRITLELPLFEGLNTTISDAAALAGFAAGLDVIINLIQWNQVACLLFEASPLIRPQQSTVERFRDELIRSGLKTSLRLSKGTAIAGACGQLGVVLH